MYFSCVEEYLMTLTPEKKLQCARYYVSFLFVPTLLALFKWPNFYTADGRFLGYIKPHDDDSTLCK